MTHQLLQVLLDIRYFVALDRTEQAGEIAHQYRGPYYELVRGALEHGVLPPIRIDEDMLCMVGLIYCVPEFAARAQYVEDEELSTELSRILEVYYSRGYL